MASVKWDSGFITWDGGFSYVGWGLQLRGIVASVTSDTGFSYGIVASVTWDSGFIMWDYCFITWDRFP